MAANNYIPAGRTSLVKRSGSPLQVQTEYAYRPYPRVTTTILDNGRVIHKIEKKMERGIETLEEQSIAETVIKRQHAQVVDIIKSDSSQALSPDTAGSTDSPSQTLSPAQERERPLIQRLEEIPGCKRIFQISNEGTFASNTDADQFKRSFKAVFKGVAELLDVFVALPGVEFKRERGVYEALRDKLYLISLGSICYLMIVERIDHDNDYEEVIKAVLPD